MKRNYRAWERREINQIKLEGEKICKQRTKGNILNGMSMLSCRLSKGFLKAVSWRDRKLHSLALVFREFHTCGTPEAVHTQCYMMPEPPANTSTDLCGTETTIARCSESKILQVTLRLFHNYTKPLPLNQLPLLPSTSPWQMNPGTCTQFTWTCHMAFQMPT